MRLNKKIFGVLFLISILAAAMQFTSCKKKPEYKKWEYKTVNIEFKNPRDLEPFLNEYGKGGWELIYMNSNLYVFKRSQL